MTPPLKYSLLVFTSLMLSAVAGYASELRVPSAYETQRAYRPDTTTVLPLATQKGSDRYFVVPPRPINQYTAGEIIAVPKDGAAPVLNASLAKGDLPTGTVLFPNGCVVVVEPSQLSVGTHRFTVETADQEGQKATHSLTVKLRPSGQEDADAMYSLPPSKPLNEYAVRDVLATSQDRDGSIIRAELVKGMLPTGTSLTPEGNVVVDDPSQLQAGQYAAWIATEDQHGGITLFIITLDL